MNIESIPLIKDWDNHWDVVENEIYSIYDLCRASGYPKEISQQIISETFFSEDPYEQGWSVLVFPKQVRDSIVELLRVFPYDLYLETNHWKRIRKQALRKARFRCELCFNSKNLHVHHKTYQSLGCEEPHHLIVLCACCHEKFHGIPGYLQ